MPPKGHDGGTVSGRGACPAGRMLQLGAQDAEGSKQEHHLPQATHARAKLVAMRSATGEAPAKHWDRLMMVTLTAKRSQPGTLPHA